eukprot:6232703-Ditylum_brightwellii.AAC.1
MGVAWLSLVKEVSLPRRVNTPAGTALKTDWRCIYPESVPMSSSCRRRSFLCTCTIHKTVLAAVTGAINKI